jgi:hypothetical protein
MTKEPIMIEPIDMQEDMRHPSRLRCGKIHSIEWNVKVRNIGMVASRDKAKLLCYYRDEQKEGFDPGDNYHEDDSSQIPSRYQQTPSSYPQPKYKPMLQPSADVRASS